MKKNNKKYSKKKKKYCNLIVFLKNKEHAKTKPDTHKIFAGRREGYMDPQSGAPEP